MMRPVTLAGAIVPLVAMLAATVGVAAQTPDLSGTWRLDKAASQITAGAGLAGLGPGGVPGMLYITQAANGAVTVGSDVNESQSRIYRPGAGGTVPSAQGPTIPVATRWDGRTFRAEGESVKEALTLSADGRTLTITVTAGGGSGPLTSSTLVYQKTQDVEPCAAWPTPCRYKQ